MDKIAQDWSDTDARQVQDSGDRHKMVRDRCKTDAKHVRDRCPTCARPVQQTEVFQFNVCDTALELHIKCPPPDADENDREHSRASICAYDCLLNLDTLRETR